MPIVSWSTLRNYFYNKRNNKVPEGYYRGKYEDIRMFFKNKKLDDNSVDQFIQWLERKFYKRNNKKISNSYYNKYLQILKVVFKLSGFSIDEYSQRTEAEDAIPTEKLTLSEYMRVIKTFLPYSTDQEYRNLLDILTIKILCISTQRPNNVYNLKWSNYRQGYLYFEKENTPKNRKPHRVYIPENIQSEIEKLRRYPHGYIFGYTRGKPDRTVFLNMLQRRCEMADITKHITPKSLRGTGIRQYLKEAPVHQVMKISGHRDPSVLTTHYYDPEDGEIERIIEQNPFDPKPLTSKDIIRVCGAFVSRLQTMKCQAFLITQDKNLIITVPIGND